jgi:4-diphosphocytidyl-2C-methyl-D-erythritol kinase
VPSARELLANDLQPAAIALCPPIERALEEAREVGAEHVLVSGSGPTVMALFPSPAGARQAERAVAALAGRDPEPIRATSVGEAFGRPEPLYRRPC